MEALKQIVIDLNQSTLETLCYLTATVCDHSRVAEDYLVCAVKFDGKVKGEVWLRVTRKLLGNISKNMLGYEEEVPLKLSMQQDAFLEYANIFSANLLPSLTSEQDVLMLTLPTREETWPDETYWQEYCFKQLNIGFEIEEQGMDVMLLLSDGEKVETPY